MIGLATLLIAVGIFLFYAANWRYMSPWFKLSQVFALIIGMYGAAYYFLAMRDDLVILGRAFLILGMISFGVCISLVAQIYHISAHPANGVLIWCLGCVAISLVAKERWGMYLSLLLLFIWNQWECVVYENANFLFLLIGLMVGFGFYYIREKIGMILLFFVSILWLYEGNVISLDQAWRSIRRIQELEAYDETFVIAAMLLHLPIGLFLVSLSRTLEDHAFWALPGKFIGSTGWCMLFLVFLSLSWPILQNSIAMNVYDWMSYAPSMFVPLEYLGFLIGATCLTLWARRNGKNVNLLIPSILYCACFLFIPLSKGPELTIAIHLGMFAFFFGMLYASVRDPIERTYEKWIGESLVLLALIGKSIGLLVMGAEKEHFFVVYGVLALFFVGICFLISHLVRHLVGDEKYSGIRLRSVCAILVFIMIYALSFKMEHQELWAKLPAFASNLLIIFVAIMVFLYAYLLKYTQQKGTLIPSAIILGSALIILLITGPGVSWIFYSLAFNFLLFILEAAMIYYSTIINSSKLANLGIICVVVHVFTRYFDIFWDLLSGSTLFLFTGVVVMLGGYFLEKNRRKLLKKIQENASIGEKP